MRSAILASVTFHVACAMPSRRGAAVYGLIPCLLIIFAVVLAQPGRAAPSIYTVQPVSVDVTAESAAEAREQALANAHERAFRRLIDRIVPRGAQSDVPTLSYDRITPLVRDFEVTNEKTSSVRYLADLIIRFQQEAVRNFLREHDVPFAETRSAPVLVLPVYGPDKDPVLWGDRNPWRDAWAERSGDGGLVPLEVPLGDLDDMESISARAALDEREKPLARIAARYDAEDVLVTQAIPRATGSQGAARVKIVARRISEGEQVDAWVNTVAQRADEKLAAMYRRAADQLADAVERSWKLDNVVRFESEANLTARVPVDGLDRWVTVRQRLESVPIIGRSRVRALSRQRAEVQLTYFGDLTQLRRALAQVDLKLSEPAGPPGGGGGRDDGARWTLEPATDGAGGRERSPDTAEAAN